MKVHTLGQDFVPNPTHAFAEIISHVYSLMSVGERGEGFETQAHVMSVGSA